MRAVQAAKAANGEVDHEGLNGDCLDPLNGEAMGKALDGLLHSALWVLKPLLDELYSQEPQKRGLPLAFWLLERAGAPAHLVKELRDVCARPGGLQPSPEAKMMPPEAMVVKPPSSPNTHPDSPKKKASVASALKHGGGSSANLEGEPNTGEPDTVQAKSSEKKKVAIWRADQEGGDSDSDDDPDSRDHDHVNSPREQEERQGEAQKMKGSRKSAAGLQNPLNTGRASIMGLKQRRFTVNITKSIQEMPPDTMELLRKVPALKDYSDADMHKIMDIASCHKYESEENLITHGGIAEELHVIVEGAGKVCIPYQIAKFGKGDYFGEEALRLAVATSTMQVSACSGPVTTVSINRKQFQLLDLKKAHLAKTLGKKEGLKGRSDEFTGEDAKKAGICGDCGHPVVSDYVQSEADREVIIQAVKANKMLGEVLELTDEQCALIADSVYIVSLKSGQTLMAEGDKGSSLFILQEGLLDVNIKEKIQGEVKLRTGDSFGEIALLYETPRSATVVAVKDCLLWVLTRADYKSVASLAQRQRIAEYSELLTSVPVIVDAVKKDNITMVANVLEKVTFYDGEELCLEGEDEGLFFLIYEGDCQIMQDGEVVRSIGRGEWIGEEQLLHMKPADYTVRPTDDNVVTALVLEAGSFGAVLKAVEEMQKSSKWSALRKGVKAIQNFQKDGNSNPFSDPAVKEKFTQEYIQKKISKQAAKTRSSRIVPSLRPHDVRTTKKMGVLGEGAFGSVLLLEDEDLPERRYALKILSKEHIQQECMAQAVSNERSVMNLLDSDFIVRLYQTYQDELHIFFMMEPVLGGELFDIFVDHELFCNIPAARFYIACVSQGLQHMHTNRVIWRDLKLENCLVDEAGYVKLTDMGIAKIVIGKTYTICGTADYFAPETLRQSGHDRAVDWWACGVLLFMMATGRSPFDAPTVTQIYKNIMKGFSKVTFPENVPSDLMEVIKSLCRKKPEERITMQKGGVSTFMEMPFFSSLKWEQLTRRELPAPFVPPPTDFEKIKNKKLTRDRDINYDTVESWDGSLPE